MIPILSFLYILLHSFRQIGWVVVVVFATPDAATGHTNRRYTRKDDWRLLCGFCADGGMHLT